LQDANRSEHNRTYTPFRELKVEETYAVNGQLLHELYFENMGSANRKIGPQMRELIEQNFGSIENYKQDLIATAGCARGWAITAYGLDDGRLHNYLLEEHNENVPVLAIPLLVLDVYEHAYMIDFGIKRDPYLELFWNHINWQVVEARIDKWVNRLR
jgi:Fe-Mn family superoxide dismutase